MKSTKTFNNISEPLRKQIPKLKKGEKVLFRMLNGVPNPEPDDKERTRQGNVLYGKRQLLTHFRVYDENLKDETGAVTGGFVEVGCVDVWLRDNPEKFRVFIPGLGPGNGSFFQGKFELVGGKIADEELFEILWISPERKGTPCPDDSVEQIFEIVNVKSEGEKVLSKVDKLYEVLGIVKNASESEMTEYMASINQPSYQDFEVLKAKVSELAKNDPDAFLLAWKSSDKKQKATIKKAVDAGVLNFDIATGDVKVGNTVVTKMQMDDYAMFPDEFSKFISSAANGADIIKNVENQLSVKTKDAATVNK